MQKLQDEMAAKGKDIQFVAINGLSAKSDVGNLTAETDFPVLQDNDKSEGWTTLGGSKDDFYIYDSEGKLAVHLPFSGTWATNLGEPGGWEVATAVLEAID